MPGEAKPPHGIFELATSETLSLTRSIVYAGCGLLLLGLALAAFFYWRYRKKKPSGIAPALNPWEQLRLLVQKSAESTSDSESMGLLNHSLRRGLELRWAQPYTAFTSAEIVAYLQKNPEFSSDFQAECAEFLKTADRVLFAYQPFPEGERVRWEKQVAEWVESLREGRPL